MRTVDLAPLQEIIRDKNATQITNKPTNVLPAHDELGPGGTSLYFPSSLSWASLHILNQGDLAESDGWQRLLTESTIRQSSPAQIMSAAQQHDTATVQG